MFGVAIGTAAIHGQHNDFLLENIFKNHHVLHYFIILHISHDQLCWFFSVTFLPYNSENVSICKRISVQNTEIILTFSLF